MPPNSLIWRAWCVPSTLLIPTGRTAKIRMRSRCQLKWPSRISNPLKRQVRHKINKPDRKPRIADKLDNVVRETKLGTTDEIGEVNLVTRAILAILMLVTMRRIQIASRRVSQSEVQGRSAKKSSFNSRILTINLKYRLSAAIRGIVRVRRIIKKSMNSLTNKKRWKISRNKTKRPFRLTVDPANQTLSAKPLMSRNKIQRLTSNRKNLANLRKRAKMSLRNTRLQQVVAFNQKLKPLSQNRKCKLRKAIKFNTSRNNRTFLRRAKIKMQSTNKRNKRLPRGRSNMLQNKSHTKLRRINRNQASILHKIHLVLRTSRIENHRWKWFTLVKARKLRSLILSWSRCLTDNQQLQTGLAVMKTPAWLNSLGVCSKRLIMKI